MKLSKEAEAAILKAHDSYWNSYLKGDVPAMVALLTDDYTQVGSAEDEVFNNKEKAVQFLYDTIGQVAGKLEMRNRNTTLQPQGDIVMVHERCDVFAKAGTGWFFYSRFRATTLMIHQQDGWKIIHQHSSFPDTRAGEGENVAVEKMAEENQQLKEAVRRRTIELEQKTRELEIESSLERVRTVAMSMNKTDDVLNICKIMFTELKLLGFGELRNALINFWDDEHNSLLDYDYSDFSGGHMAHIPYNSHPTFENFQQRIRSSTDAFAELIVHEDELESWKERRRSSNEYEDPRLENIAALYYYFYSIGVGAVGISTFSSLTEEKLKLLKRFRNVFDLSYRRYMDIKKAEAQAREAQIEAALERTRTQSMLMQHSDEIEHVSNVFHEQLLLIGIPTEFSYVWLPDEAKQEHQFWATWTVEEKGTTICKNKAVTYLLDKTEPYTAACFAAWQSDEPVHIAHIAPSEVKNFFSTWEELLRGAEKLKPEFFTEGLYYAEAYMKYGCFGINIRRLLSEDEQRILCRFTVEFERSYTRFLDLKNAEAQAREARIEAAMEKVRSRALAMQKPGELVEVAELLRKEMGLLGVEELETSSIYIHHEDTGKTECWYAIKDVTHPEKELVSDYMTIDLSETWVGRQMLEFYRSDNKRVSISMQGANRKEWINYCADHSKGLVGFYGDHIPDRTYHLYKFSNGYVGAASPGDISTESWDLLQRVTSVFSLAYTRFSDLQQAEAQAKEAKIEAALERVRSRTLAMQKSDELAETAAVLFKQLIGLGIAPNRLYIGIINDDSGAMEFWITDEDGTKVSTMFSGDANKNASMKKMYDGWLSQKKSIVIDMQGKELDDYFHYLGEELHVPFKDGLSQKRRLQYISYFSKGFIGMASPGEQPQETVDLVDRFAYVFNLTFTRFSDLKIAEAHALQAEQDLIEIKTARKKAEDTLSELQATQRQLIQSEKMASLGELTAGIAHEIQNPLNFVNNFSEVNKELIEELKEERHKAEVERNIAIEDDLLNDIDQNLDKIAFHGKRADAIVKGMLQHSRTSTGQKEPTDINALCDEYLRLSYHGLRAKDKSFNTDFKTDFDNTIGKINIVPQDIGRVVLNLFNNAFYAVYERRKAEGEGFKATVSVQTKKLNDKIEIRVVDNGNGIPQNIIEKIFQPFFTTKPTGQGTGLGLSLAYDIITKEHNGTIKVESKEGAGSEFIILLPV